MGAARQPEPPPTSPRPAQGFVLVSGWQFPAPSFGQRWKEPSTEAGEAPAEGFRFLGTCQRYPEATHPARAAARGSPATQVMPPIRTGANRPSRLWQGKSRPCRRVSSRDAKTEPLGDPALEPAPPAAGEGGISRSPVSLHPVSRISRSGCPVGRRAAAGSDPGHVSGRERQPASLPLPPRRAWPGLTVCPELVRALIKRVWLEALLLACPRGAAEQCGHGSWDPPGAPSVASQLRSGVPG